MIKSYKKEYLSQCADSLISAYNGEPWECFWTQETACRSLEEYSGIPRFAGFTLWEGEKLVGGAFCHERTCWNDDELFIDELFISRENQGKGLGTELLKAIERYVKERNLVGMTLLTNKYMPAPKFYRNDSFVDADHVIFMYKITKNPSEGA